jgi:hypothetical protein
MTHYYNVQTNDYPRYQGDLELLGWTVGEPLPENWVEVIEVSAPEFDNENETLELSLPKNIDSQWHQQIVVRPLTVEEKERKRKYEEAKSFYASMQLDA